jgi:hypothetical protein
VEITRNVTDAAGPTITSRMEVIAGWTAPTTAVSAVTQADLPTSGGKPISGMAFRGR